MLPSRGARWSQKACRVQAQVSGQNVRLYSIATPRRPSHALRLIAQSQSLQSRSFSSTPLQAWSFPSLWNRSKPESSSEFATSTSNEFANYSDFAKQQATQAAQVPAEAAPQVAAVAPTAPALTSEAPVAAHHGTPLTGPEHLLPDPVTHVPTADVATALENIPEHIGYLKELGLDYGYGTSTPMQMLLESIHIYSGLPWFASAMSAAVIIRLLFLRMQIRTSDSTARWNRLKPIHGPLTEELKAARLSGDQFKAAQLQKDLMALRKEANLAILPMVIPMLGQMTLGFGLWRNLRGMAEIPIPALEKEQLLWMKDLSVPDSSYALAAAQAGSMYLTMRMNASSATPSAEMQAFQGIIRRALPILSFAIVAFQPAIVQIYFLTSSALNLSITALLKNQTFRSTLKLAPFPENKPESPAVTSGSSGSNVPTVYSKAAETAGITLAKPASIRATSKVTSEAVSSGNDNVSWIDKQIEAAKKLNPFNAKSGANTANAAVQRKAQQEKQRVEQYEERRRKEVESERIRRNEQARRAFDRQREREQEEREQKEMMSPADADLDEVARASRRSGKLRKR